MSLKLFRYACFSVSGQWGRWAGVMACLILNFPWCSTEVLNMHELGSELGDEGGAPAQGRWLPATESSRRVL